MGPRLQDAVVAANCFAVRRIALHASGIQLTSNSSAPMPPVRRHSFAIHPTYWCVLLLLRLHLWLLLLAHRSKVLTQLTPTGR
jgi:hypothetical protein